MSAWTRFPFVPLLIAARTARSIGQGALSANFILELKRLGWSAPSIGFLLSGGILFSILATLVIGPASDRLGRKRFLLGYESLQLFCAAAGFMTEEGTPSDDVMGVIAIVGGFGQTTGGGAGPFSPVEQSWLARLLPVRERGAIFSVNTALGFAGMAIGALTGLYSHVIPGTSSPGGLARAVFLTVMAGAALALLMILLVPDKTGPSPTVASETLRQEWSMLRTLIGINALNGISLGLYAPLMAYWFSVRFHKGPDAIGIAMSGGYLLAAILSYLASRMSTRYGTVLTVIAGRGAGLLFTLLIPLMPTFGLAVLAHILRVALNQSTIGARQALSIGLVGEDRQGLAASLHNVSMQIPQSVGPIAGAALIAHGWLGLPFFLGAILQGAYLGLYYKVFSRHDPSVRF
ncbi:MAG: MFS transporter [Nitrospirae bacterium]|nr:MFS transporter [Nitrospirota bacterium]MCL5285441.1 MFS transporter [Nitrospirota bacterium]